MKTRGNTIGRAGAAAVFFSIIAAALLIAGCNALTPADKAAAIDKQTVTLEQTQHVYTAATQAAGQAEAAVRSATTQEAPALIALARQADSQAAAVRKQLDAQAAALVKLQNAPTFDPNDPGFQKTVTAAAEVAASVIPGAQPAIPFLPIIIPTVFALAGMIFSNRNHAATAASALDLAHKVTDQNADGITHFILKPTSPPAAVETATPAAPAAQAATTPTPAAPTPPAP